jgi:16S rRNA (uracil1498-N3)-methyltransferase
LTAHRFYIKEKAREAASIFLEGPEHLHLSKVARIGPGERVQLFDENGNHYLARVEKIEKRKTRLLILERHERREPEVKITLAQVVLKTRNMDLVIQKATELGTDSIVPVISERTIVKMEGIQDKKWKRWNRVAIEASKQCGRSAVPDIMAPVNLTTFIQKKEESKKLFLSERGGGALRQILIHPIERNLQIPRYVILLVGPEGGWTEREEQDIMKSRYEAVSLGSLTLRSETAAIVGLAMVSHFWKYQDVS